MTDTYIATLDRIVDGQTAVLLLEADDETVDQLDVHITALPAEARHEGAVLEVTLEAGDLRDADYLPAVTQSRTESAQDRLDRLSRNFSDQE